MEYQIVIQVQEDNPAYKEWEKSSNRFNCMPSSPIPDRFITFKKLETVINEEQFKAVQKVLIETF